MGTNLSAGSTYVIIFFFRVFYRRCPLIALCNSIIFNLCLQRSNHVLIKLGLEVEEHKYDGYLGGDRYASD